MTYEDEINSRMAEQEERHHDEVRELKNKIAELEEQNKIFINIVDNQSKAIDIFKDHIFNLTKQEASNLIKELIEIKDENELR